jgi:quercetin dioxygenase-like cupin family protein
MSLYPPAPDTLSDRSLWHLGGLLTIKILAGESNGSIGVVEERALRGYSTPPHVHTREDETLYVINGELEHVVDGKTGTAREGDAVFLPRGVPHHFRVTSTDAHFLVIMTPGGFEEFFQHVSPPASAGNPPEPDHTDPARMTEVAAQMGTTVFRSDNDVVDAATALADSDDPTRHYRTIENAVAGPIPAPLDRIVAPLVRAARQAPQHPTHARALILLGIMAETDTPARPLVHAAAPALAALAQPGQPRPAALAFAYFLAHFPSRDNTARTAIDRLALPDEDRLRALRCLDTPDFTRIGRVWPSPSVWTLDDTERDLDRTWRSTLALDETEVSALWESETTALLAYLGAKAENAVTRSDRA